MKDVILDELARMERDCGVRALLAIESGSRAWGMASEDSDYDVRFVYVRPVRDYLRLEKARDAIEWKLDEVLDITGWDLVKFLRLMRGSNPSVFEWLSSPIVYAESGDFAGVREIAAGCFSPKASAFHYLGMERGHDRAYLRKDTVSAKKYLYVVRALLAARWCLEERTPVPMRLDDLLAAKLPKVLTPVVRYLLDKKLAGEERLMVAHIPELDEWAECEDAELFAMARAERAPKKVPWELLDDVFTDVLQRDCAAR